MGLSRIEEGVRELERAVSLDPAQGQAKFHVVCEVADRSTSIFLGRVDDEVRTDHFSVHVAGRWALAPARA